MTQTDNTTVGPILLFLQNRLANESKMIDGEEEPDISRMLGSGVDIDGDGDFDPTSLLSQPIDFNESIDELDINIHEETGENVFNDPMEIGHDTPASESERRERFFRTASPDSRATASRRQDQASPRIHSPRDYDPPPYPDENRASRGKPRQSGTTTERIAEVQQRIRQVQQQIQENMDGDLGMDNRQHPFPQEPGYPRHGDQEHATAMASLQRVGSGFSTDLESLDNDSLQTMYQSLTNKSVGSGGNGSSPNNYPRDRYYDIHRRDRFLPRDSPRHERPRSYNGMPSSMRGRDDAYGHSRRRSHQEHLQQHHRGPPGNNNANGYGPQERRHPNMHPMEHVLGGMSRSLHKSNNRMPQQQGPPPHGQPRSQSYNGMNSINNGIIPRRGIQSMSESLNGAANALRIDASRNGMNPSKNVMDYSANRGIQSMSASLGGMQNMHDSYNANPNGMLLNNNMPRQRGIQSMSASLNGMKQISQPMNGMQGGYIGPESMNQKWNVMERKHDGGNVRQSQQRSMNPMSASQNGMPNLNNSNRGEEFPTQHGGNPLQGLSQSLNSTASAHYDGHHPSMQNRMNNIPMQMNNSNNMGMMGRSNNATGRSMNGSMNASNNKVPSASLLNQASNLANLANRGANIHPSMVQGTGGSDTTKLSQKLMDAMKRTASSRKLIKDFNIVDLLRGGLNTRSSSLSPTSKHKNVIKAKRKASRQSYTKSKSEATASREFVKAQTQQEHDKPQEQLWSLPQAVPV